MLFPKPKDFKASVQYSLSLLWRLFSAQLHPLLYHLANTSSSSTSPWGKEFYSGHKLGCAEGLSRSWCLVRNQHIIFKARFLFYPCGCFHTIPRFARCQPDHPTHPTHPTMASNHMYKQMTQLASNHL